VGLAARIFGEQIALYGILLRAIDVNALFIGVKKPAWVFVAEILARMFGGAPN
jgi:hypothetical protein